MGSDIEYNDSKKILSNKTIEWKVLNLSLKTFSSSKNSTICSKIKILKKEPVE